VVLASGRALKRIANWCRRYRHEPVHGQWTALKRKLLGHVGFHLAPKRCLARMMDSLAGLKLGLSLLEHTSGTTPQTEIRHAPAVVEAKIRWYRVD
jgi:hypothetical protein